ncbi:hypothetical protein EX30DRAFT_357273 [Ascodesmis nigricans]|uniref:Uncharacterized protein n=1 Tax=Ascodesmis nigricans TaxID=341454 RepID=A0A4S2N8A3_9PEZI|nr:hypothetical protein EX30DRAFT_357273 [Ascodesmis nigricans]
MAGVQLAVRWSPHSVSDGRSQRFVTVNGGQHTLSYCGVTSTENGVLKFREIVKHPKIPFIRCLDWSPLDHDLIALGASSGEALLLRLSDGNTPPASLPIKHQRQCNDVSFNSLGTMVAQGLDKVRNDFCLNIWDVNERLNLSKHGLNHETPRPARQLASGESIHSVKFTKDNPHTIICGASQRYLRLHDLRESPSNPAFICHSRCILGITLDKDPNYFASHADDGTVVVWDIRAARTNQSTEPVLTLSAVDDDTSRSGVTITTMRYSPERTGLLAVSTANGVVRVWETAKLSDQDSLHHSSSLSNLNGDPGVEVHKSRIGGWRDSAANLLEASRAYGGTSTSGNRTPNPRGYESAEMLLVQRTKDLVTPPRNTKGGPDKRIVGFDWMIDGHTTSPAKLVAIDTSGSLEILRCPGPIPGIAWGSRNQFAMTTEKDLYQMPEPSLKPTKKEEDAHNGGDILSDDGLEDGVLSSGSGDRPIHLQRSRSIIIRRESTNSVRSLLQSSLRDTESVLRDDISVTMRRRAVLGYQMDCAKNYKLAKRENKYSQVTALESMWSWLEGADESAKDGGMRYSNLDLSFLGVTAIWLGSRQPTPASRLLSDQPARPSDWKATISNINKRNNRGTTGIFNNETNFPEHRRLALAICGWEYGGQELEDELARLEKEGERQKAAGWALFHNRDLDRAITCLQKGDGRMKLTSTAIAGYFAESKTGTRDGHSQWRELASEMATSYDDPYIRAIFAYVASEDWDDVIDETVGLPLQERIGIALRWLTDDRLTTYLTELTDIVVRNGDLNGIMLTGVTEKTVDLLQVHIDHTADVQTAALVASFASPKYFKDERVEYWVECYRSLLNSWQMFHARARFDVARGKASRDRHGAITLEPPQRQVYVRCANCDKPISHSAARKGQLRKFPQSNAARDKQATATTVGGPKLTVCPHCKKSLPRCAVCLLYLGTIYYKSGTDEKEVDAEKDYDRWFNFCLSCNHGMHAGHAREWFSTHRVCPVPECECACKM